MVAPARSDTFVVAKNPDPDSALPYLIRVPIDGGMVLKARDVWPRTGRVYCHPAEGLPADAEIIEEVAVRLCVRRGAAMIDLVLDRPRESRSQLLFTEARGRRAIFWQTQKVAKLGNPGGRVPRRKADVGRFEIAVDTRERYGFRFAGRDVAIVKVALPAGDYAVLRDGALLAAVERKSLDDLIGSLTEGKLGFQLAKLAELPHAGVVVEGSYPGLVDAPRSPSGYLPDVLARLQLRYPTVSIVFAHSRKYAEEWTFRWLAAALDDQST
jgi:ERCC4 domain